MIGRQQILCSPINLRQKLGVMFGDPWTTSGGKLLTISFINTYSFKEYSQIKDKKNNTIGMKM